MTRHTIRIAVTCHLEGTLIVFYYNVAIEPISGHGLHAQKNIPEQIPRHSIKNRVYFHPIPFSHFRGPPAA